jgi:hypothetical protein
VSRLGSSAREARAQTIAKREVVVDSFVLSDLLGSSAREARAQTIASRWLSLLSLSLYRLTYVLYCNRS